MVNAEKQLFSVCFIFTEDAIKEEATYNNESLWQVNLLTIITFVPSFSVSDFNSV